MNESKLNMSKLAAESGKAAVRSVSDNQDKNSESLQLSRLEVPSADARGEESGALTKSFLYPEALKCLAEAYDAARRNRSLSHDSAIDLMKRVVDAGRQELNALFLAAIHPDYREDTVVYHSVNAAILAVMIGHHLGIPAAGLVKLGTAALFHDIGTVLVPDEIFYKTAALSHDEMKQVRQRPVFSRQILSQLDQSYDYLAEIAFQVYERQDGSGYPSGLTGADIHEYARIIGLADVYEAMIHSRPYRDRFLHFHALKEIFRTGKHSFDRRHLKALMRVVSFFPVFSFVRLNSGTIGRVLEIDAQYPTRPRVKILYDAQHRPMTTERIVDLKENTLLFIADAVAEEAMGVASV